MKNKKIHLIYLAEDGIATLTCGVGSIAMNFVALLPTLVKNLKDRGYNLQVSVITLWPSSDDIGIRKDLYKKTKKIISSGGGRIYLIKSIRRECYFDLSIWERYNRKAKKIINKISQVNDADRYLVLANDGIFGRCFLNHRKIINVWIPHSLSLVHKQSYADNLKRLVWERVIIDEIGNNDHYYLGYISDYVKSILLNDYQAPANKLVTFKNGFYYPWLNKYKYRKKQVINYLKSRSIDPDQKILLAFNRADEYKGLDYTLKAMIRLANQVGYQVIMIASRFSREKFIQDIQDKLKRIAGNNKKVTLFLGYEFELPKYLIRHPNTKILFNIPKDDFCPLVPFECELLGHKELIIINSRIGCFQSVYRDEVDGFLANPNATGIYRKAIRIMALEKLKISSILKREKQAAKKKMNLLQNYQESILNLIK